MSEIIAASDIQAMIAALEEKERLLREIRNDYEAKRDAAIPFDIKETLNDIAAEFDPMIASTRASMTELEEKIGYLVILAQKTIKGEKISFRYNGGKVSWDSGMLEGMSALLPQINAARKEGKPYVSVIGKDR